MKIKQQTEPLTIAISFDSSQEKANALSLLATLDKRIIGWKNGKEYLLPMESIYYIESLDKQTLIYTRDDLYESCFWLYQMEEELNEEFIRINKQTIINMHHVETMKSDIGARIIIELDNQDRLVVTRAYAKAFKQRLGGN